MSKVNLTQASWGFYSRLSEFEWKLIQPWCEQLQHDASEKRLSGLPLNTSPRGFTPHLVSLHLYLHPVGEVIRCEDNTQMTGCNRRNCMCLCSPCPYLTSGFSQYFDQIREEGQQNIWWFIVRAQFEWVAPTDSNLFNSRGSKPSFSLVFQTTLIKIRRCAHHSSVYFPEVFSAPFSPF